MLFELRKMNQGEKIWGKYYLIDKHVEKENKEDLHFVGDFHFQRFYSQSLEISSTSKRIREFWFSLAFSFKFHFLS